LRIIPETAGSQYSSEVAIQLHTFASKFRYAAEREQPSTFLPG